MKKYQILTIIIFVFTFSLYNNAFASDNNNKDIYQRDLEKTLQNKADNLGFNIKFKIIKCEKGDKKYVCDVKADSKMVKPIRFFATSDTESSKNYELSYNIRQKRFTYFYWSS